MTETGGRRAKRARAVKPKIKRWTKRAEAAFLDELSQTANVSSAARRAEMSSSTCYTRRKSHPMFAAAWAEALAEGYIVLEAELLKRAIAGIEKPVWRGGEKVGSVTEYSDAMGMALLKRHSDVRDRAVAVRLTTEQDDEALRAEFLAVLSAIRERLGDSAEPGPDDSEVALVGHGPQIGKTAETADGAGRGSVGDGSVGDGAAGNGAVGNGACS